MQITTIIKGWKLTENKGMLIVIDYHTVTQLVSENDKI